jgi:hypothetical protein
MGGMTTRHSTAPAWRQARISGSIMLAIGIVITIVERLTEASFLARMGPGVAIVGVILLVIALAMWQAGRRRALRAGE